MSKIFLFLIIAVIFYSSLILYSDFSKFSVNFFQMQFEFIPLILILSFAAMVVKGVRQHLMLQEINVSISIKNSILLYLLGSSMTVTPGGMGSIIKSYFLKKKYGVKISKTFPLIILERFHDLLAITSIVTITLFFIQRYEIILLVSFVLMFLLIGFITIRSQKFFFWISKIIIKIPKTKKFIHSIEESYDGFNFLTKSKIVIQSWILSIIAWGVDAIIVYLVFMSFDVDLGILFTTFFFHSSFLLGAVTIIPAGLGITEITATKFLIDAGLNLSIATSIIITIRLVTTWFATIVGFITTKIYLIKEK